MRVILSALLIASPLLAHAADNLVGMNRFRISVNKPVASDTAVEFYTTADGGRSWLQVPQHEVTRPEGGKPNFVFTAPKDGTYGFWTRLLPADGKNEPAPRPGDTPEISYRIDTTPPVVSLFSAALERDADQGYQLMAAWEVSDPHLGATPVRIQASTADGGAWVDLGEAQAASGRCRIAVPQERLRIRLQIDDLAGNRSHSPATIPVLVTPEVIATPEPAAPTPSPSDDQPTTADTDTDTDTGPVGSGDTAAPAADPVAPAVADPLPSLDDMEAQVDRELADSTTPAASTPTPAPSPQDPLATINGLKPSLIHELPAPAGDLGEETRFAQADTLIKQRPDRLLIGQDADTVLGAARAAAQAGDLQRAATYYARLHDSALAATALPEEIMITLARALPIRAQTLVREAPPETRSDAFKLAAAYAWFGQDPSRSWDILLSLRPEADCHLEAQILRARCLLVREKPAIDDAIVILRNVARHQGRFGAHAQELLDLLQRG